MDQALAVALLAGREQVEAVALADDRGIVQRRDVADNARVERSRRRGVRLRRSLLPRYPGKERQEQKAKAGDRENASASRVSRARRGETSNWECCVLEPFLFPLLSPLSDGQPILEQARF
jgi:hypothetical protein